jgi:hypothetical protein
MSGNSIRGQRRIERSQRSVDASRKRMKEWLADHTSDAAFVRFRSHFDVLDYVLNRMLDALAGDLARVDCAAPAGQVYEHCASLDRGLTVPVRLFEWYAAKYGQRSDPALSPTLLAADEVIRSCWSEPFARLGQSPPTGPLAYLDAQYDAYATPRVSVPSDLRAPADSLVAEFMQELPVPTIALPAYTAQEAWWLVLAAHETGHHVQKDLLPALPAVTSEHLATAAPDQAAEWARWALEAFADAYSVVMAGGSAVRAVDELQFSTPSQMFRLGTASSRYPPPPVRLALLGECLAAVGQPTDWPTSGDMTACLRGLNTDEIPAAVADALAGQLAALPAVARALMSLPIGTLHLRDLRQTQPGLLDDPQQLRAWARQLTSPDPALPTLNGRAAARLVITAGTAAWQTWAGQPEAAQVLPVIHDNLLRLLPRCGPPGVLEQPPDGTDLSALGDQLADRLLREALRPGGLEGTGS